MRYSLSIVLVRNYDWELLSHAKTRRRKGNRCVSDTTTTMIYTHVLARPDVRVVSPLERLSAGAPCVAEPPSAKLPKVDVAAAVDTGRIESTVVKAVQVEASTQALVGLSQFVSREAANVGIAELTTGNRLAPEGLRLK